LKRKSQTNNADSRSKKKPSAKSVRKNGRKKTIDQVRSRGSSQKGGSVSTFNQKQKKLGQRSKSNQRQSDSTCSGIAANVTCLANLKNAMKYDRDQITNFKNQLERAEDFHKLIGNKGGKNGDFSNSTTYLLIALGGNMTNLECSGNSALTENATETYNTLANCSEAVAAACAIPDALAPNFTQLTECKTAFEKVEKKNGDCLKLKSDIGTVCDCWSEAAGMVVESKALKNSGTCESKTANNDMKSQKEACLEKFSACKKAEDASVAYIMSCAGSANLAFEDESGTNSSSRIRHLM